MPYVMFTSSMTYMISIWDHPCLYGPIFCALSIV